MRLSVILICHNQANLLPRSLSALQEQRDDIDEIYLVDNASSDDSLSRLRAAAATFKKAYVIANSSNIGAIAALNTCLRAASGRLIYFAAADDFILPGFLSHHLRSFSLYPNIGISSCLSRLATVSGADCGIFPSPLPRATPGVLSPEECRAALYRLDHWFMGNAAVFHRAKLLALGGFNPAFAGFSDAFCCFTLALRHGAAFSPQALAVKRGIEAGMGSAVHADAGRSAALWRAVESEMVDAFSDIYDLALRSRLRGRWQFNTARAALQDRLASWPPGMARLAFFIGRALLLLRYKPFDLTVTSRRRRAVIVSPGQVI